MGTLWKGLVTNASPFVVPPGAATEQVNLTSHVPGQLTSRNGLAPLGGLPANTQQVSVAYRNRSLCYLAVADDGTLYAASDLPALTVSSEVAAVPPASGKYLTYAADTLVAT